MIPMIQMGNERQKIFCCFFVTKTKCVPVIIKVVSTLISLIAHLVSSGLTE